MKRLCTKTPKNSSGYKALNSKNAYGTPFSGVPIFVDADSLIGKN